MKADQNLLQVKTVSEGLKDLMTNALELKRKQLVDQGRGIIFPVFEKMV